MNVEGETVEGGEVAPAPEPTLRESLSSAFAEHSGDPAPAPEAAEGAAAPQAKPSEPAASGDRPRAPDGKFAPKDAKTPDQAPGAAAEPAAQAEAIRPPASWSAAAKAKFPTLDPAVQAEIVKRERDVDNGLRQQALQLQRYKPIDDTLAPGREQRALQGQDDATYVRALVTADSMLASPDKARAQQALQHLARVYNIPLPQAGQGQQPQPQGQVHPDVAALRQQVQTLSQTVQQRQQAEAAASQQQVQSAIQAFEADPKNLYFPNVRDDMGVLLQTGRAQTLEEAYDMACNMRPDIRKLVADQSKAQPSDAARQRTQQARIASGSVTGAPGPGSSAQAAPPNRSIRDELKAQFDAAT